MKKLLQFTNILFCTLLLCFCMSPQTVNASNTAPISIHQKTLRQPVVPAIQNIAVLRETAVNSGSGVTNNGTNTQREYTISFNANYGILRDDSRQTTVNQRLVRLPYASRDGYTFRGWYTQTTGGTQITTNTVFTGNTEVYAQWDTVNTDFNDILISNITDSSASLIAVIPNSYVRTWGVSIGTSSAFITDTRSIDLYRYTSTLATSFNNLTPNTTYFYRVYYIADTIRLESGIGSFTTARASEYTITFNPNGGTTDGQSSIVTLNQRIPVLPGASRQDYRFDGWYTEPYSGTLLTTDTPFHSSCMVYAHWTYSPGAVNNTDPNNSTANNNNANNGAASNNNTNNGNGSNNNNADNVVNVSVDDDMDEPVSVNKIKLKSVKNTGKGKVKVKWKWDPYTDGYQIAYSQKKNFPSDKTNRKTAKVFTDSKTISGLKKGKTYYVKVRAYQKVDGKKYYGAWSNVKKIKTKK